MQRRRINWHSDCLGARTRTPSVVFHAILLSMALGAIPHPPSLHSSYFGAPSRLKIKKSQAIFGATNQSVISGGDRALRGNPRPKAGLDISRLSNEEGLFNSSRASEPLARNPKFPKYSEVRTLLVILPGTRKEDVRQLIETRQLESGTVQDPVSWRCPDEWITKRLDGRAAEIALSVWVESGRRINPARIYGSHLLIRRFELLTEERGVLISNQATEGFIAGIRNRKNLELDYFEGLFHILKWIYSARELRRTELLSAWTEFCVAHTNMTSSRSMRHSLSQRVSNLKERDLISEGNCVLSLSEQGRNYIDEYRYIVGGS